MAPEAIPLLGGKSVHCINELQMAEAERLASTDPHAAPKLAATIERLEHDLSRNERAALAFLLIKRLKQS